MAEEENKNIAEVLKGIGSSVSVTIKKSFQGIANVQDKGSAGFLRSAEDLVDDNKSKQDTFASDLSSIKDAIISNFSEGGLSSLSQALKDSATKSITSLGSIFTKQSDEVEDRIQQQTDISQTSTREAQVEESSGLSSLSQVLKDSATKSITSLGSIFTRQSDEVEDRIQQQTDFSQDSAREAQEGQATQEVLAVEGDREKAQMDSEQMQILRDIRDSLKGSFGAVKTDRKKGGLLAGLLGGIGAGIGAIAKGIAKIGMGFAKGLIALGAGIAGFMIALGAADVIIGLMGADGTALKTIIGNFFGAFDDKAAILMGGLIAIAAIMAKLKISSTQFAFAMGSLGAGIGGFFLAIGAASWVADAAGLNGVALAELIRTFFGAFDAKAAVMMGGIVAIAAICAKLEVNPVKLAAGMTAIGWGLAGFFSGIIAADFVASIAAANKIDGTSLKTLMGNFFDIFDSESKMALLAGVIGVGALAGFTGNALGVFAGMTAVGMGLAGFFGGIILADAGASIAAGLANPVNGSSLKTLMDNFFSIFDSKTKVATLSAVLGIGALTGIIGGPKAALGIFAGMTAMGAGLAGFFGGILLADWLASIGDAESVPGASLKILITNFVEAFASSGKTGVALLAAIMGVGAITGIVGAAVPGVGAAVIAGGIFAGMTALGAGLVGFFGGIILADKITEMAGVDGSSLATMITNFLGAFKSENDIKTLAVLLAAAGIASFNPLGVAAGMTAIGAGLVGFFAAFTVGSVLTDIMGVDTEKVKTFMGDIGEGIGRFVGGLAGGVIKQLKDIDGQKLKDLGDGIAGVGVGIAAFGAGQVVGVIGGVIEGLGSFFGVKSPIDRIIALSADKNIDAKRLKELGEGIGPLGEGLKNFSGLDLGGGSLFGDSDLESFIKMIAKLGSTDVEIDTVKLNNLATAITPMSEALSGLSGVNMKEIVDKSTFGDSALELFFKTLSADKLALMATPEQLQNAAKGVKPLGAAIKEFGGIDMDAITGGWGEDNLGKFFEGVGTAVDEIKDPSKIHEVATGIEVLGKSMQSFKGIDSDDLDFTRFFASLEKGDPERMKKNLEMLKWIKPAGGGETTPMTPSIDVAQTSEALGGESKSPGEEKGTKKYKSTPAVEIFTTTQPEGFPVGEMLWSNQEVKGEKGQWFYDGETYMFQSDKRIKKEIKVKGSAQQGALIQDTGLYMLHGSKDQPEFVLDNQAASVFLKAATLLSGSEMLDQNRAGGGSPVVINQVDNSQTNPVISNQATQIKAGPDSPHTGESTKMMLDQAYAMG